MRASAAAPGKVWLRFIIHLLAGCMAFATQAAPRLPQDAYVWQRAWTPALLSALNGSSDLIREWRVLTAESDLRGRLRPIAVNWRALALTHRPAIAVLRIDGQLANWSDDRLLAEIRVLASGWRGSSAAIDGIEIDYDCGTARLSAYAHFLTRLRGEPGIPKRLSVTALPAWMESPDFDSILAATDEVVLQVHAVRAPRWGLFDADLARRWIAALDRRSTKPFRVALPDYSARIVQSESGTILAVESEMPKLAGGTSETELVAPPQQVSRLLHVLEREPPRHLAGIVWFRLPTAEDTRTWSLSTWRAVIAGKDLSARIGVVALPGGTPQLANIVLQNAGDIDTPLPFGVDLPRGCALADGINGYGLHEGAAGISLERLQSGLLYAHHAQVIGWMRCPAAGANFHVRP